MSTGETANAAYLMIALMLPLSALLARRIPLKTLAGGVAAWTAIFGVGYLIAQNRDRLPDARRLFGGQRIEGSETRIPMDPDGHFWADVEVNGMVRRMLIDSGATTTAMSADTAAALGIDTKDSLFPAMVKTANGTVTALPTTAHSVRIGSVHAEELAVLVSPAFDDTDVVGMNFLSQLHSWRVEGRMLILTPEAPK